MGGPAEAFQVVCVLAVFMAVTLTLSRCGPSACPPVPVAEGGGHIGALEAGALALANEERMRRGVAPLAPDPLLAAAARQHSREMWMLRYFDHYSPNGSMRTPSDRYRRFGGAVEGAIIGENLFYGTQADVLWSHRSLMASLPHRENLLSPSFTRAGIGIWVSPSGEMWVTQMFAGESRRRVAVVERLVPVGG